MRKINKIIIHCSASDRLEHDNVETIKKWHVEGRGWTDVGYHYIVTKATGLELGRPVWRMGAHVMGQNFDSIGICLTGLKQFSEQQFEELSKVCAELKQQFGLKNKDIVPHNKYNKKKSCPNFDLKKFKEKYLK